jgi:hypothetical protein
MRGGARCHPEVRSVPSGRVATLRAHRAGSCDWGPTVRVPEEVLARLQPLRSVLGVLRHLPPRALVEGRLWGEPDVKKIECQGGCGWGVAWRIDYKCTVF